MLSGVESKFFEPLYPAFKLVGIMAQKARELRDQGVTLTPEELKQEMDTLLETMDTAMALVVPEYQKLLKPIMGLLTDDLAAAYAGSVDPYSLAQAWFSKFPQYGNYQFTRLARTEIAFGIGDQQTAFYKREYGADEEIASRVGFGLPPWHPNCGCDRDVLTDKAGRVHIVGIAPADACPYCHAIANQIFDLIEV